MCLHDVTTHGKKINELIVTLKFFLHFQEQSIICVTTRGILKNCAKNRIVLSNLICDYFLQICLLPLQVLLVSNNRLLSLPEELGRMDQLTELDLACNLITHLPARMSDLKNLKSLSLRSNQLVYIPKGETTHSAIIFD